MGVSNLTGLNRGASEVGGDGPWGAVAASGEGKIQPDGPLANLESVGDSSVVSVSDVGRDKAGAGEFEELIGEGWATVDGASVPKLDMEEGQSSAVANSGESLFSTEISASIQEAIGSISSEDIAVFRSEITGEIFLEVSNNSSAEVGANDDAAVSSVNDGIQPSVGTEAANDDSPGDGNGGSQGGDMGGNLPSTSEMDALSGTDMPAESGYASIHEEILEFKELLKDLAEDHCVSAELAEQIDAMLALKAEVHLDQQEQAKEDLVAAREKFLDSLEAAQEKAMRMESAEAVDATTAIVNMLAAFLGLKQSLLKFGLFSLGEDKELTKVEWKGGLAFASEGPQGPAIAQKKATRILDTRDRYKKFEAIVEKVKESLKSGLRQRPKAGGSTPVTRPAATAPIARPRTARRERVSANATGRNGGEKTETNSTGPAEGQRISRQKNSQSAKDT